MYFYYSYRNFGDSYLESLCLLILFVVLTVLFWVLETPPIQSKKSQQMFVYKVFLFFNILVLKYSHCMHT